MTRGNRGLNALAIIAILFLLGFGFVAYAVPGAGAPAPGDSTNAVSSDPSRLVYFHLVAVSPDAKGANASGYAGISVNGGSLTIEWSITGGSPGQHLTMSMQAASSEGANRSITFATVQVSQQGTAGATDSATFDSGDYQVGLKVVGSDTSASPTLFVSDPATAQVTIGSSQPPPAPTAVGDALSYTLVPLPAYLHQDTPAGYQFKEGGALIVISGDVLRVTASFLGSPDTAFTTVVQTPGTNFTVGTVTTTHAGGGVLKGNVTFSPGTYQVGLLLFVAGKADAPVAVSVPRAILVTIGSPHANSSTTSSSTESSSQTSTSASSSTTTTPSSGAVSRLEFAPLTTSSAPHEYSYGQGSGGYAVTGGNIYFSLAFTGQNPNARYSLVLSINGSDRAIDNYTTDDHGAGSIGVSVPLGTGTFALGLTVLDLSSFDHPTAVLASVPSSFTVVAHARTSSTTTSITSTTTSSSSAEAQSGHVLAFKLMASNVENVPNGYKFASSGTAVVSLNVEHSVLDVEIGFQDGNPSTTYTAALLLNGTAVSLGTMTTNRGGGAVLHSSVQANPGAYLLGVVVYDVSDVAAFNSTAPVRVLVSSPSTELAVIGPSSGSPSSSTTSSSTGTTSQHTFSTATKAATTISGGVTVQAQIQSAVGSLTIPATVQVTPLQSSTTVLDPRFSLSVGQQAGNGLVIAISGENVTGPRVLLINLSRTAPLSLYPALNVTLDGLPVAEASSALQVLNPVSTNPPLYVLVSTSDSLQLLVSIPHFSLHLIQVAGVIVSTVISSLELDAPLLLGSIVLVSLAFAAAYAVRKRYF